MRLVVVNMKRRKLNRKEKLNIYAILCLASIVIFIIGIIYFYRLEICLPLCIPSGLLFIFVNLISRKDLLEEQKEQQEKRKKLSEEVYRYFHRSKNTYHKENISSEDQVEEYLNGKRNFEDMDDDAQDIFLEDYDGD